MWDSCLSHLTTLTAVHGSEHARTGHNVSKEKVLEPGGRT